ncbi:MAG TPA: 16S rRNA (cytosine(1402)-N(4))-methyltransferase RsmH [Candidatus Mcinerneyibacteriales bacterium]|nr:16S rRNA (cytosine(1402)-N(4))-methyltransferase RsmH [Candidatus Mcinerneyibacteriales bacterium]HPQ90192.1 16S rRNA (cytosine(1402)-N(4))-methyltransferase RsmH [Candidatus Mcinerneyibacteriales bacterium]
MASYHEPVLLKEVLEGLSVRPGGSYLDLTLGGGGHAEAILKRLDPGSGLLAGADQDEEALEFSKNRLSSYSPFQAYYGNFGESPLWEKVDPLAPFDGILMDLGVSSHQLDEGARGFSFSKPAALDMRMDRSSSETAWQVVNRFSERELADILFRYGEERRSRRIAKMICTHRPVETTVELAEIVRSCFPAAERRAMSLDPATRTFQGIRIYVNRELERLERGLKEAVARLRPGGRLVVISYHSLEDRIVKNFIRTESRDCLCPKNIPVCVCGHKASLKAVHKKVIIPDDREKEENPRSRSARMRVAERL